MPLNFIRRCRLNSVTVDSVWALCYSDKKVIFLALPVLPMKFFINRILAVFLYVSFPVGAVVIYRQSLVNRALVLSLFGVLLAIMLAHFICRILPNRKAFFENALLTAGLLTALVIQYFDTTTIEGFYVFYILAIAVLYDETRFGVPFAAIGYIVFLGLFFYKTHPESFNSAVMEYKNMVISRTGFLILLYIIHRAVLIGRKNEQLALSLQKKNEESEALHKQVTAYSEELERTADIRAKEKLMNELHNKLAHLLATASIGANAAAVLVDKDAEAAKYRLDIVTEQIHAAMQSLRDVISGGESSIASGEITFNESILKLINETEKRTDIPIRHSITEETANQFDAWPVSVRSLIYNALMEGLTNGLRHGKATAFDLDLRLDEEKTIRFALKDNGAGFDTIVFGNGLSKMRKDAAKAGAEFEISGKGGCTVTITVPREAYEENGG